MQTSTYQPYSLEPQAPPPPRSSGTPETSIGRRIPQPHDTRPPSIPGQQLATAQPEVAITEKEAQKTKPVQEANNTAAAGAAPATQEKPKPRSRLRAARKAAISLTPPAIQQLRNLLNQPEPKLIKVGVKNRGCSGLSYNLEYVDKAGAFDETVEQDGVKVLIDSKALFSIIGSEMDYVEDKLSERFVFKNPNISKWLCGNVMDSMLTIYQRMNAAAANRSWFRLEDHVERNDYFDIPFIFCSYRGRIGIGRRYAGTGQRFAL